MKIKPFNLLLRSLDQPLSEQEKSKLDEALRHSEKLKEDKVFLENLQKSAKPQNPPKFRPFFAERVMQRIQEKAVTVQDLFFESLYAQFKPLVVATAAVVFLIMSYNMLHEKSFSIKELLPTTNITYEEAMDPTLAYFKE